MTECRHSWSKKGQVWLIFSKNRGSKQSMMFEFTWDAAGCSKLSIVEYSATSGLNFI